MLEAAMLEADVVVVGAGVYGSSAALFLARAGRRTILLEQFPIPHSRGSSHGQTRIIRQANYETPALTPIMADGFKQWQQIQKQAGETLMRPSPMLVIGSQDQRALLEEIARSVKMGGHTPQWSTGQRTNHTFGMNLPADSLVVIDPSAGILLADKCVAALQRLFRDAGGRLLDSWPVDDVEVAANGSARVIGLRGTIRAESVVLCPGPWAKPVLAKLGVHLPLRVEKIAVLYWRIKDPSTPTTTFIDLHHKGLFGGLKELEYPGLVKLVFHGGLEIELEERDQGNTEDARHFVSQYVKERHPGLHPQPTIEETCMYTCTPDGSFVLDRHPKYKNIIFACGFSDVVLAHHHPRRSMEPSPPPPSTWQESNPPPPPTRRPGSNWTLQATRLDFSSTLASTRAAAMPVGSACGWSDD
ncbi:peroxisomal sarcosine oxidase-like isoform X3 [Panulirus ornatus]